MKTFIQWFFERIAEFFNTINNIAVYENLSIFHLILGGLLLMAFIKLFTFGFSELGNDMSVGLRNARNNENKKDKKKLYNNKTGRTRMERYHTNLDYSSATRVGRNKKIYKEIRRGVR